MVSGGGWAKIAAKRPEVETTKVDNKAKPYGLINKRVQRSKTVEPEDTWQMGSWQEEEDTWENDYDNSLGEVVSGGGWDEDW